MAFLDLLGRQRAHDEFDEFVASHVDALVRAAHAITGDSAEAEDLVQECLLRVAKRWPRVRSMDSPGAYARRILVNLALDGSTRRRRRGRELPLSSAREAAEAVRGDGRAHAAALGTHAEIIDALRALPPRQRTVLVLRYLEDLSEREVAAALGCSLGTVKSTASRGLGRLRSSLEVAETDPARQTSHRAEGS